jgi:hypothetical protein
VFFQLQLQMHDETFNHSIERLESIEKGMWCAVPATPAACREPAAALVFFELGAYFL